MGVRVDVAASPTSGAAERDSYDEQGRAKWASFTPRTLGPTPLPRHTDVSREQIRLALCSRGRWSCFATPKVLDAVRVKVSASVRRLRVPYRTLWEPDRWRFTAYLPVLGECATMPTPHEWDELEAVFELARHARTHVAMLRAGH